MRGWASSGVAYQGGSREGGLRPKSCAVGRRIHRRHGGGVGLRFREARRERPRERGDPAQIACADGLLPAAEFPAKVSTNLSKPACSYTGMRYTFWMIRSFGDKRTETLFWDGVVREFRSIAPRAKRKLEAVNAASRLEDLRVPPSNRLEKLKGNLSGFHSIRVNDQWRIIFKWLNGEPHAVQIVDYH